MNVLHITGMKLPTKLGGFEKWLVKCCKNGGEDTVYISYDSSLGDVKEYNQLICENKGQLIVLGSDEEIVEFCNKCKIDAVFFHFGMNNNLWLFRSLHKMGVKLFAVLHCENSVYLLLNKNTKVCEKIKLLPHRLKSWYISKYFKQIFGVSNTVTIQNKKAYFYSDKKISTLYIGIDTDGVYEKKLQDGQITIANIAFHNIGKGVDILIEALEILKKKYNNIRLLQIGGSNHEINKDTMRLKELCERLGVTDNVTWIGLTNDVNYYLAQADIYCQPSRNEALCLAIMEGMNNSMPIVASNVGGIPEIVHNGENGFLFNPDDGAEALASCLEELILDEKLRADMGKRSKQILNELNLSTEKSAEMIWSYLK